MNKFVLSVFTLVFAVSFVFAQENKINLEQVSDQNKANITQSAKADQATVLQKGGVNNFAEIEQVANPAGDDDATNQRFNLTQNGAGNRMNATTGGVDNRVKAEQIGNSNRANIELTKFQCERWCTSRPSSKWP